MANLATLHSSIVLNIAPELHASVMCCSMYLPVVRAYRRAENTYETKETDEYPKEEKFTAYAHYFT